MSIRKILSNVGAFCVFFILIVVLVNVMGYSIAQFGAFIAQLPKSSALQMFDLPVWAPLICYYLTACGAWLIWRKKKSFFSLSLRWYYAQLLITALSGAILYFQSVPLIVLSQIVIVGCSLQVVRLFYRENKIAALCMTPFIFMICNDIIGFIYPLMHS